MEALLETASLTVSVKMFAASPGAPFSVSFSLVFSSLLPDVFVRSATTACVCVRARLYARRVGVAVVRLRSWADGD